MGLNQEYEPLFNQVFLREVVTEFDEVLHEKSTRHLKMCIKSTSNVTFSAILGKGQSSQPMTDKKEAK